MSARRLASFCALPLALAAGERALTSAPHGHQIHHDQAFSPDGRWIHFDARPHDSRLAESAWIGRVEVATGRVEVLFRPAFPGVGAVVSSPADGRLVATNRALPGPDGALHVQVVLADLPSPGR